MSIDNVAAGHVYSCLFQGQAHYGTMSRGASQLVIESCVYEHGEDAVVAKDEASRVDSRGVCSGMTHNAPISSRFSRYQFPAFFIQPQTSHI